RPRIGIDKACTATVNWARSTVSHPRANRECGAERLFQSRSCPRNCKRRARATLPLETIPGRRSRAGTREPGDLPLIRSSPGGALRGRALRTKHPNSGDRPCGAARVGSGQSHETDMLASADAATVYVCVTCQHAGTTDSEPRPGAILAAAATKAAEGSGVIVKPIRCLANCTRGLSAG